MTIEQLWWVSPVAGAIGGFLAGMLGVGGGVVFIPVLSMWFTKLGLPGTEVTKFALANSILLVFFSGINGLWVQSRKAKLDWKPILQIGIPGTIVSTGVSFWISTGDWYSKEDFYLIFLVFLCLSLANMLFGKKAAKNDLSEDSPNITSLTAKRVGVGLLAGLVVALSGLGGGVIMVPLFRMLLKIPLKKATLLSLSIIPLLSLFPLFNYAFANIPYSLTQAHTGYIVWPIALPMAAGVFIFSRLGMKIGQKMPVSWLRTIFATITLFVVIKTGIDIKNAYSKKNHNRVDAVDHNSTFNSAK